MSAKGARYKWREGNILHASRFWKSYTMRRLPRILIEDRALEVGLKMYVDEPWMVFTETTIPVKDISREGAIPLELYKNRFHLLPRQINGDDTYKWLSREKNALLVWGLENHYFAQPSTR